MNEHISIERMNEALDGLLSAAEREPVARHLEECAACRNEHARLVETVRDISALPREARAPEGAWTAIAARIHGAAPGEAVRGDQGAGETADVVHLPSAAAGRAWPQRVSLSVPQLAAAAAVVAAFSAGLTWMAIGGGSADATPLLAEPLPVGGAAARAVSLEDDRYGEVVLRLETIVREGRALLTPETLTTIDGSLASIDAAIAEVEAALARDPGSDLLQRMLISQQRTRLGVLQRAAAAVQAQT